MNVEEAGGDEFQEEHLPEGGQGFDLSTNDILNQVWESVEDAYKFYRRYGRVNGFRVRKGDSETRTGCKVMLSIYLEKSEQKWKDRKVVLEHNHDLAPVGMSHLIQNHRKMTDAAKAHIDGMHAYGIGTSKILGHMAADGDATATLIYLEGKAAADPMYVACYNHTKDERLGNMVWADGNSRSDFQCFGDVWMLQNLLEVMCQKKPCVAVTDGDKAMIKAVKSVLPEATHRLCAWHVEKNVTSNEKDERLRSLFKHWLYVDMEVHEFKEDCAQAIEEYGLHNSSWARHMHKKRKLWANGYLRDKFYAGFQTMTRCEGIIAMVNKFSKSSHTIFKLVQNLELVLREYRNKEMLL
ncbi:protein FAR1-RELATED SEQUENCE 5-like [Arachis ipaensis]|uniref:protein FAR1-RELATED SEQUENCE 5-like n=1 Tax=Arachis ipaensis TaxID=130454 RepID=UPI0007AFBF2F|nr:protein FAR1-RELATED SEQUENCE 5-like [Arachis ipaensis]